MAIALAQFFRKVVEPWIAWVPISRGEGPEMAFAQSSSARQHPMRWSSTMPADCMSAYIVVGPTKR